MSGNPPAGGADRIELLSSERARWLAFLRQRVRSDEEAEEILQESLLRAVDGVGGVRRRRRT